MKTNCYETDSLDEMHKSALKQFESAKKEYHRLKDFAWDVMWYHFETEARSWKHPWAVSEMQSPVLLKGRRYVKKSRKEIEERNIYYFGTIGTAPLLPAAIIFNEVREAKKHMLALESQVENCYSWAPGGKDFEAHMQNSVGAKLLR